MTPYFFRGPFLSRGEVYYVRIRRLLARIPKVGVQFKEQRYSQRYRTRWAARGGRFGLSFIKDFQPKHRYVLIWVLTDKLKFQYVGYMESWIHNLLLLHYYLTIHIGYLAYQEP